MEVGTEALEEVLMFMEKSELWRLKKRSTDAWRDVEDEDSGLEEENWAVVVMVIMQEISVEKCKGADIKAIVTPPLLRHTRTLYLIV